MNEWAKVALAVTVVLFATFLLSEAFRLLAGIEVTPIDQGGGENERPPEENAVYQCQVPINGTPPHTPMFEIVGAPRTWFLRESVGEVYENGTWKMIENSEVVEYSGGDLVHDVKEFSSSLDWETTIVPIADIRGFIPIPDYATRVEGVNGLKYFPSQRSFYVESVFQNPYSIAYRVYSYDEDLLESADTDLDPAYLQLPPEVTERTKQLAIEITQGTENPYENAKAIENYLRTNYTYDLNYTRAPAGWDPIDWFLFEERRGHCMNFNSAFVVLARSVGIPSRTVFGYAVDPDTEYQIVYADDSHCNAEVKFENLGWVPFNATAPHPDNIPPVPDNIPPSYLIPTETRITEVNEVGVKGGTFGVRGRVVDENGGGVDGVRVLMYLMEQKGENAPACGSGLTENGWFDITCEVGEDVEVGDYYVVAHSLGNSVYRESWSDPKIKIVSGTTIQLSGSTRALVGRELSLEGRLTENLTCAGLGSREIVVEYGGSPRRLVTDGDGSFQVGIALQNPDNYIVSASFLGSSYYLPSSSEHAVEAFTPFILPTTSENLARGETARVSGEVPVDDLTVQIYFNNEPLAPVVSVAGGAFEAEHPIPASTPLGNSTILYTVPELTLSETQEVAVCSKTSIEYDAPSEVGSGENLKIIGRLHDDLGAPLPEAWLTLEYADRSARAKTDNAGAAAFEVEIPPESGEELGFALLFEGSGFHLPSEKTDSVVLTPGPPAGGLMPIAVTVAAGAAASVTVAVIVRRRKRKAREKAEPAEVEKAPRKFGRTARKGVRLGITFPQIKEPFPDVWGADDPLQVSVCLTKDGEPVGGASLRVGIGGEEKEVRASASGEWKANHRLGKGTHKATAKYTEGKLKLKVERDVRIVDYREEIVGVFNSVLESLRGISIDPGGDLTPREIQNEAREKIEGVDAGALDELVKIFEVANYSLHEIGRKEYERAYLSSQSVTRSMGGQA